MVIGKKLSPTLFLDRDGVINKDFGYVHSKENFEFIDGIFDLVKHANSKNYLVIIITNQAGIAHGYYSEKQFKELTSWMFEKFLKRDAIITDLFYCPYHESSKFKKYRINHPNRKPAPGMFLEAIEKFSIDVKKSIMVGDQKSDMIASKRAGINKRYLFSERPVKLGEYCATDQITKLSNLAELL